MGDRTAQSKTEEQYPLLKIDGGGDSTHHQPTTVVTAGWCASNQQSRCSRWPEFISACWMTLILFGILILVFYALGMGAYRRHQFIILRCNDSKPASNVFYHHIVQRGSQVPFIMYSEYLANMAIQYPLLNFNVYFLVDDYYPVAIRQRRNIPFYTYGTNSYKMDEINKEALSDFQRRYDNVNFTIVPLSKFMATTPLNFKWRLIPLNHLPFYIRVFSVWQNGGIGIDLRTFNNEFHNRHSADRRIDVILRQHNDGINAEGYANALNKIDKDEENAILNMLLGVMNRFLNETRSFLNRTVLFPSMSTQIIPQDHLVRVHRAKREATNNVDENSATNGTVKDSETSDIQNNISQTITNDTKEDDLIANVLNNTIAIPEKSLFNTTNLQKYSDNGSDTHEVVCFYDFSITSDVGPTYILSEPNFRPRSEGHLAKKSTMSVSHLLSIEAEGEFIAASSRLHPLLGRLISAGCQRMPPKLAIQGALLSQCSGLFKDVYCNSIYIL